MTVASLVGRRLPSADLPSTDGGTVNLSDIKGRVVLFIYPYTGRPDHPDPPGWDHIPGAHGSTPQARGFSEAYTEFQKFGMKVFGMSFQNSDWQREFVQRTSLPFRFCLTVIAAWRLRWPGDFQGGAGSLPEPPRTCDIRWLDHP